MNQKEVLRLCRALVDLNESPQPGIASWHIACEETANELRVALGDAAPAAQASARDWTISEDGHTNMSTVDGLSYAELDGLLFFARSASAAPGTLIEKLMRMRDRLVP